MPTPKEVTEFQEARRTDLFEQGLKIAEDKQKRTAEFLQLQQKRKRSDEEKAPAALLTADASQIAPPSDASLPAPPQPNPPAPPAAAQAVEEGAAQIASKEHFGRVRIDLFRLPPGLHPVKKWNYPSTDNEAIRSMIFEDLWRRQYYLTPAAKFGGDYLAYKGDPLKYHALFVIIVQPWTTQITARDLVSIGRLAVTVKKAPVIATIDNRTKTVKYFTVDWQGVT